MKNLKFSPLKKLEIILEGEYQEFATDLLDSYLYRHIYHTGPQALQSAIRGLDVEGWPSVIIHCTYMHWTLYGTGVVLVCYWYGTFVSLVFILAK